MEVSIIIPTYGRPSFLKQAINSVLNQTFKDWELIIVDDNNPDSDERRETRKIVESFDDERIKYLCHPQNLNGAVARNTGLAKATGKYISFLDSDDEYYPQRLEKCHSALLSADKKVAGVFTGCEFKRAGETYHVHTDVKAGNYLLETLACTFMFCTGSNIFMRRSVIDEINGFDGSFLRHQDYEFLVRVFEKYSLEAIPEVLVIKNNENLNLPNVEKMIDIKKQYLAKYEQIINGLPKENIDYIYHSQYLQIAEAALRSGKKDISKSYYHKAGEYGGLSLKERLRKIAFTWQKLLKR